MTPAEEHIAYYRELGLAIAQWAEVERSMYLVVSVCFPVSHRHVMGIGFVAIEGFRSKLHFADKAVTRTLVGTQFAAEWAAFVDKLGTQSITRNKLAHNQTRKFPTNAEGRRLALCPWIAPKGTDQTKPPPSALCVIDIIKIRLEFETLTLSLRNFAARICKVAEPFPKFDEQPKDQPTIRQIARQIHEELEHPQQSAREKRLAEDAINAAASLHIPLGSGDGEQDTPDTAIGQVQIPADNGNDANKPEKA